jgi:hypothetical protein
VSRVASDITDHVIELAGSRFEIIDGWLAGPSGRCTCEGPYDVPGVDHHPSCGFEPLISLDELAAVLASAGWTFARQPVRYRDSRLPDRFWTRVTPKRFGCWIWEGGKDSNGYSFISWEGRNIRGHQLAYQQLVGPVPEGLQLDHLCERKACVNPNHLEPVTQIVNILRSATSVPGMNARKSHCKYGHPFSQENTYRTSRGHRQCRSCRRARRVGSLTHKDGENDG